jgi:quercetin dioxygenase-like cupin family protein
MTTTFEEFTAASMDEGFDEVLVREWEPHRVVDTHTHPFDVSALVVRGEFKLTLGDRVVILKAGDPFRLARDIPHIENYGPEGATVWVARAN